MAFDRNKFSLISAGFPGVTPRIWAYDTTDEYSDIIEPGVQIQTYFEDEKSNLEEGDIINVRFSNLTGAPLTINFKVQFNDPTGPTIFVIPQNAFIFSATISDISTAGSIWIAMPTELQIVHYLGTLQGAISGSNATVTLNTFGGPILNSSMAIVASGSGAGDVTSTIIPTDISRVVQRFNPIEIVTDGASTGVTAVEFTIVGY